MNASADGAVGEVGPRATSGQRHTLVMGGHGQEWMLAIRVLTLCPRNDTRTRTGVVKHTWEGPLPHTAASSRVVPSTPAGGRARRAELGQSMGRIQKNGAGQRSHVVFPPDFGPSGLDVPRNTDSINASQSVARIIILHQ